MNKVIIDRILKEADYIIKTEDTVRNIAKLFKVSKSTVHKDLQERLLELNPKMHIIVDKIFGKHIEIRHIRGGQSTKNKYKKLKEG